MESMSVVDNHREPLDNGIDVAHEAAMNLSTSKGNEPRNDRECYIPFHIQWHPDFLVACATVSGHCSWRSPSKGSWFIQSICLELTQHWLEHDLVTILSFVTRKIAHEFESNVSSVPKYCIKKQATCIHSMLTKLVKFRVKNGNK